METCVFKGKCPRERRKGCDMECSIRPEIEFLLNNSNLPEGFVEKTVLYPEHNDTKSFVTLDNIKRDIVNFVNDGRFVYLWSNNVGTGKAQPMDSHVYTKDGYVEMKDIKVGMEVFGEDGKLHKVLGVYPQGMKDTWTVSMNDFTNCRCSGEHLWTLYDTVHEKWFTKEFQELEQKDFHNYELPKVTPLDYGETYELDITPYFMGMILTKGYFEPDKLTLYNIDDYLDEVKDIVAQYNCKLTKHGNMYRVASKDPAVWYKKKNVLIRKLRELGLFQRRRITTHIPKEYLRNTVEVRRELLDSMMEHGYIYTGGDEECILVRSEDLAEDTKLLAQSLGYLADIRKHRTGYIISIDKNGVRTLNQKRYVGKKECQCIYIDSPTHIYLTDNLIPTHNTTWTIKILKTYLAMMCIGNGFKPRAWFEYSPTFTLLTKEFDNENRQEHIDNLRERDLVIIDDIGSVNSSNYDLTILSSIIDYRYSHKKATLFTSNLSVEQLAASVGARLADRIASDIVIELKGSSRREYTSEYIPKGDK